MQQYAVDGPPHMAHTIPMDGRTRTESEKITINVGHVDLGHIDLLVREGFYSNRTDFIRTAIRTLNERHADATRASVDRRGLELGLSHYNRADLEAARASGTALDIRALGLLSIAPDVPADLARATIRSLTVLGSFHASQTVKDALKDRID